LYKNRKEHYFLVESYGEPALLLVGTPLVGPPFVGLLFFLVLFSPALKHLLTNSPPALSTHLHIFLPVENKVRG
jgi:hypothetical protein